MLRHKTTTKGFFAFVSFYMMSVQCITWGGKKKKLLHGSFIFQKYSDRGKTSRTTKHFPQTQFGLILFFFPWINTNASAYIQFIKYMYISCFEWVHNDTQLPFEMWITSPWFDLQFPFESCAIDLLPVHLFLFFYSVFLLKLADFTRRNCYILLLKSKQWHSTVYS